MKTEFRLIIFLVAIFVSTHSIGQYEWKWGRSVARPQPGATTEAWAIASDHFGHVYGAGLTGRDTMIFGTDTLSSSLPAFCFLVKYTTAGDVVWAKVIDSYAEGITSMATDSDGNLYIAGSFNTCSLILGDDTLINPTCTTSHSDEMSCFVAKLDSNGRPIWARQLLHSYWFPTISLDKDGDVFLSGAFDKRATSFGGFPMINHDTTGLTTDMFLAKLDNAGNILWVRTAGGDDPTGFGALGEDYSNSVATDTFGNVFITGHFSSRVFYIDTYAIVNPNYLRYANVIFTAKYSSAGNLLWVKCPDLLFSPGAMSSAGGAAVAIATDYWGNCYVTGGFSTEKMRFDSFYLFNFHEGEEDIFFAKYSPNGNMIWARSYGGYRYDIGDFILVDSFSQNVWLTGSFTSDSVLFGGGYKTGGLDARFFIKYDTGGVVRYVTTLPGGGEDWGCLASDDSGSIYLCGDFEGASLVVGRDTLVGMEEEFFMAKLGLPSALIELNKNEIKGLANSSLIIYPNPAKETITIKYDHTATGVLTITNMAGQIVQSQAFTGLSTISTAHYVPGIYMCRVVVDGQAMVSRFRVE